MNRLLLGLFFFAALVPDTFARNYDTYRTDFGKTSFCAAMGGACASTGDTENSYFRNPASLLGGEPGFDFDADYTASNNLEPGMKNGNSISESAFLAGVSNTTTNFGYGIAVTGRRDTVVSQASLLDDQGKTQGLQITTTALSVSLNVPLAYRVSKDWVLGVSILGTFNDETIDVPNGGKAKATNLDSFPRTCLTLGATWNFSKNYRFGSWFRTPLVTHQNIQITTAAFGNTLSYNEDIALSFPWFLATGVSWMPWEDGRILAFNLDVVGATPSGYLLTYDTFASSINDQSLRRKGKVAVLEPHLGWRAPWSKNSPWTYLVGTFYENSRWDGLSGRLHGSAGVAYKFKYFEALAGAEVARDYFTLLINVR